MHIGYGRCLQEKSMAKVLMVDDEELFCKTAGIFLSRAGHEVHTAGTSREAIDWGSHFRPEVLLTDRMLENSVHGLDITRALQLVTPDLPTILITGYPSRDLEVVAKQAKVFVIIEKPCLPEIILTAVQQAIVAEPLPPTLPPVGVVEVDASGTIVYTNGKAKELLSETCAGRDATHAAVLLAEALAG